MNEFLKISWRASHPSELEHLAAKFLTEEDIKDSYIYKNFDDPITSKSNKSLPSLSNSGPYIPGLQCYQKVFKRSLLTKVEKYHCLIAMELIQSGKTVEAMKIKEKYSLKIFTESQSKILQENSNYLEFIKSYWEKGKDKNLPVLQKPLFDYANNCWEENYKRALHYPQFYKDVKLVGLTYDENEGTINYECISNLLEVGTLARFVPPQLHEKCSLSILSLPQHENKITVNSRLPVSQDKNILKIAEIEHVDAVISSSGIQNIIDNTHTQSKWILPVTVKEIEVKNCNGKIMKKKVVFIDKALPKHNPKQLDFRYFTYKHLIKTNLCEHEAFTYPNEDIPAEEEATREISMPDNDAEVVNKRKKFKRSGKIHYNANYRIWKIQSDGPSNELIKNRRKINEIKLLVRCKLDGCEMNAQNVLVPSVIKPKVEQQIQYGANIPSKSELAREWSALFFRPFTNLYRVRINPKISEVISLEKCTMQKVNSEAMKHYAYKPYLGLGILQKILEELIDLETGNYILQHLPKHGAFVAILKECKKSVKNSFDLHADYLSREIDTTSHPEWLPIDVNYILPSHKANETIPAIFEGFEHLTAKNAKKKKKKKNKQKKKIQRGMAAKSLTEN